MSPDISNIIQEFALSNRVTPVRTSVAVRDSAPEWYYHRGLKLIETGDYEEGLAALQKAVKLCGDFAEACCRRGVVYHRRAQYNDEMAAEIHAYYAKVEIEYQRLRLYPTSRKYLDARYDLEVSKRRRDAYRSDRDELHCLASACFDAATIRHPGYASAYFHRGRAKLNYRYIDVDDRGSPGQQSWHEWREFESWYDATYELNVLDTAAAMEDFGRALDINPEHFGARKYRGIAWLKLNHPGLAIADLDVAVILNPADAETYRYRSEARRSVGQYADAISDLNMAQLISPELTLFPEFERQQLMRLAEDMLQAASNRTEQP